MSGAAALDAHLAGGETTVCRCWRIVRRDGARYGFTDHDRDVRFDGDVFRAESGLTARAISQSTGLSVDNSEALGVLSGASLAEADIEAGRFDAADVEAWLVNWQDPEARRLLYRAKVGEIARSGGAFRAEMRGLTEVLNRANGRTFQRPCSAVLGDGACGVDLSDAAYGVEAVVSGVTAEGALEFAGLPGYAPGWFARGVVEMGDGAAAGLRSAIRRDDIVGSMRRIGVWEAFRAPVAAGDRARLTAGCDKRPETCRDKFGNFLNFRGFPHIPGEDWQMSYPADGGRNDGGSLGR